MRLGAPTRPRVSGTDCGRESGLDVVTGRVVTAGACTAARTTDAVGVVVAVLMTGENDVLVEDEPEVGPQSETDDVGCDIVRQS